MRKELIGYDGYFIEKNVGIFSNRSGKLILLKSSIDGKGYPQVVISNKKGRKTVKIHRIMAQYFIENPNNYPQVNHKNGIKTDFNVENLEWCNNSQNRLHGISIGLIKIPKGSKHGNSKLVEDNIKDIFNLRNIGWTLKQIANKFRVSESTISNILKGKVWKSVH